MWFNVFQAFVAGGLLYVYSYFAPQPQIGCVDPATPCGTHDIYLPPPPLRACDFSDVGC